MSVQVVRAQPRHVVELRALLTEFSESARRLEISTLAERLLDERTQVLVAENDDVAVGTATICFVTTLTQGVVAHVEDVVVAAASRRQGVGRLLMAAVREEAERRGAAYIDLTSRPARTAANQLYASIGYRLRTTNAYRLDLRS
ncbi:MAG: GNAT family N-acetyltransferase [Frankiaceae bacterium]|nr:GNAT family N-acetyltransferase [Frankiaceae bacterium]